MQPEEDKTSRDGGSSWQRERGNPATDSPPHSPAYRALHRHPSAGRIIANHPTNLFKCTNMVAISQSDNFLCPAEGATPTLFLSQVTTPLCTPIKEKAREGHSPRTSSASGQLCGILIRGYLYIQRWVNWPPHCTGNGVKPSDLFATMTSSRRPFSYHDQKLVTNKHDHNNKHVPFLPLNTNTIFSSSPW